MVRWFRRGDMDLEPDSAGELRIEAIREIVDELPGEQSLAISLLFFGGGSPTQAQVAEEMGLSEYRLKEVLSHALRNIRQALFEDDLLGSLLAADDPRVRAVFGSLPLGYDGGSA